jgi:hypothetical protein
LRIGSKDQFGAGQEKDDNKLIVPTGGLTRQVINNLFRAVSTLQKLEFGPLSVVVDYL